MLVAANRIIYEQARRDSAYRGGDKCSLQKEHLENQICKVGLIGKRVVVILYAGFCFAQAIGQESRRENVTVPFHSDACQ